MSFKHVGNTYFFINAIKKAYEKYILLKKHVFLIFFFYLNSLVCEKHISILYMECIKFPTQFVGNFCSFVNGLKIMEKKFGVFKFIIFLIF
jgi:hypothetical protein